MPVITRHWSEREIPDLYEMTVSDAEVAAEKAGFRLEVDGERYDEFHPAGIIIEQKPEPYNLSKKGRLIKVMVSGGEKLIRVPEVVGLTYKDAGFELEKQGFLIDSAMIKKVFSNYYPRGVVVAQSIPAGSMCVSATPIEVNVSLGDLPDKFTAPNLLGMTLEQAVNLLTESGLTAGKIEKKYLLNYRIGLVIEQSPAPKTEMEFLEQVDITVSVKKDTTVIK